MSAAAFRVNESSLRALEWMGVQQELAARSRTLFGKHLCAELKPSFENLENAQNQAQAILELLDLRLSKQLLLPLGDVPDVAQLLKRISRQGSISVADLADLFRFQRAAQALALFVNRSADVHSSLRKALAGIDPLQSWAQRYFPLLDLRGEMVDDASEDLKALRKLAIDLHENIKRKMSEYLSSPKLAELMQDFYVTLRDGRYVIPVKHNFRGRVPGIIHDVSNTEQTYFIEPQEIVDWNNQLKVVEKEIEKEIERILAEVVAGTKGHVPALQKNLELVAKADLFSAAADFCSEWNQATVVEVGEHLDFVKLKHPLLLLRREVVPNSLSWVQGLILTGPNTGGKTVLLKSVGLALCLAWAGLPVPAEQVTIPSSLGGVFADIGDDQDLDKNLSTFSGHLTILKEILDSALAGDLVLIDEIATGTSPEDGQPLAQAFIERLLENQTLVFVTTHYGALKQFAMADERLRIAAMAFDSAGNRPTFEVILDVPGESSAFESAERLGFDESILARARRLRGEVSGDFKLAIDRLEEARKKLTEKQSELKEEIKNAALEAERFKKSKAEYDLLQKKGLGVEVRELLRDLTALRAELADAVKKASGEELKAGATPLFTKISDTADRFRQVLGETESNEALSRALPDSEMVVDALVEIEGLGLGYLRELPRNLSDPKAMVVVQVGDLKTRVARSRLKQVPSSKERSFLANKAAAAASRERRAQSMQYMPASKSSGSGASAMGSLVCDVRGKTVEEALRRVESALNELLKEDAFSVTVVHGHGSDRLKESIRDYLAKEREDLKYRSGSWPGEGGDGVTVVERVEA